MMTSEGIFSGAVPIFLRSGGTLSGGTGSQFGVPLAPECGRRLDSIVIELSLPSGLDGRRTLEIRLSDRNDPLFLWQCLLTEEEYYLLRREQNLLVDFHRFPHKLVELLQQCIAHSRKEHPVFAAALQIIPEEVVSGRPAEAILTITESTSFRQIGHLSLRLRPLSDQQMKKYLAEVVQRYREEMESVRGQNPQPACPLPIDYARNPSMPPQYPCDDRLRAVESQNQLLISQKMALEHEVADLRRRLGISAPGGYEPPFNGPLPSHQQQQQQQQQHNQHYQYSMQHDINKANEIIRKLQDEVKSLRTRSRTAEASVRQLEKLLKDAQTSSEALRTEVNDLRQQVAERTAALVGVQAERDRLHTELEETKKLVEANEKVIEWLHQQINEDSLNRVYAKHGTVPPLPSMGRRFSPDIMGESTTKMRMPLATGLDRHSSSSSSPPNFEI